METSVLIGQHARQQQEAQTFFCVLLKAHAGPQPEAKTHNKVNNLNKYRIIQQQVPVTQKVFFIYIFLHQLKIEPLDILFLHSLIDCRVLFGVCPLKDLTSPSAGSLGV